MHKEREQVIQHMKGNTPTFYTSGFKLTNKGEHYELECSVYKCFGEYMTELTQQPTAEQIKNFSDLAIEHAQLRDMI